MKHVHKRSILKNKPVISEAKQWGNSLGIRIPKEIRDQLHLVDGSAISISFDSKNKEIIIKKPKKKYPDLFDIVNNTKLETLTKKITKKNQHRDDFLGDIIIGKEIW